MGKTYKHNIDATQRQNYYCSVYINDAELIPKNIINCSIREWVFDVLPRIELTIADDGVLTELLPLTDETIISIMISKTGESDDILEAEFNVMDYTVDIISNQLSNVSMTGLLKTKNMFNKISKSYKNKRVSDVIKIISNDIGLNFKTPSGFLTNDNMTWLQPNISNYDMIKHVIKHSYKVNDAIFCYSDINSDINVTSLLTEVNKPISIKTRFSLEKYTANAFSEKADDNTVWFNSYNSVNINGTINNNIGYGVNYSYYDTKNVKNKNINFKTNPLIDINPKNNCKYTYSKTFGIQSKNTYADYYNGELTNEYFINSFFVQSLLLNINSLKVVKLFDKLNVIIPSLIDNTEINDAYSGEYIISGILYNISKNNIYRKQINISRSGLNSVNI